MNPLDGLTVAFGGARSGGTPPTQGALGGAGFTGGGGTASRAGGGGGGYSGGAGANSGTYPGGGGSYVDGSSRLTTITAGAGVGAANAMPAWLTGTPTGNGLVGIEWSTVTLQKTVNNSNGGTASPTDFILRLASTGPANTSGTNTPIDDPVGDYNITQAFVHGDVVGIDSNGSTNELTLSETSVAGYAVTGNTCNPLRHGVADIGTDYTCTITNTYVAVNADDDALGSYPVPSGAAVTTPSVIGNDDANGGSGNAVIGTNVTLNTTTATDGSALGLAAGTAPASGSITMNGDGTLSIAPGTTPGTYAYTYEICTLPATTPATCDKAVATVVVGAPPVEAVDDVAQTPQNTPVTLPVLANDTLNDAPVNPDNVAVTVTVATGSGNAEVNPDDTITFTPAPGFSGEVVLTYQMCEVLNPANCATADAHITVLQNAVAATDDQATTEQGVSVSIPVSTNDTVNPGGAPLNPASVRVTAPSADGVATPDPDGVINFAPSPGFSGTTTFSYEICDTSVPSPVCDTAVVTVTIGAAELRLVKTSAVRNARAGDMVGYTVTVLNMGSGNVRGAVVLDTPPAGFSYVDGSMVVADQDGQFQLLGTTPLQVGGIDVDAGRTATIRYLMRIGAGVHGGTHVNTAQAMLNGVPASAIATAQVQLDEDPAISDSLILGTVFDDRDGDGYQDEAGATGVHVQGGFDPAAYIANSTTIDRGDGAKPEPDASSPMLHGIALGDLPARMSDADAPRRIVISQKLRTPSFTDDLRLTSSQGLQVAMQADGNTQVQRSGKAARGLVGTDIRIVREAKPVAGGYLVEYIISNEGIDERGVPGVRIASVEGLIIETDAFGRYHLEAIPGGPWSQGRNFYLKVDPATLPVGTTFTTDNPLIRRITSGVPTRFDFGVKLPAPTPRAMQAGVQELGSVRFSEGSSDIDVGDDAGIGDIARQLVSHGGGELVIEANGETEALAYARASALHDAILKQVPANLADKIQISLKADVTASADPLVTLGAKTLLGQVLFDTDQAKVKPQYDGLIAAIALHIEARQGGAIGIIGHTDIRGSQAYNEALGMRRAKAVYDAISARLTPAARERLQVDAIPLAGQ